MTTGGTTDPRGATPQRSGRWPGSVSVSVRTRITVVIAVLTAIAMTGAGMLVYSLESERIRDGVTQQIEQELQEFREFQRSGIDPETGETFTDVHRLLRVFLQRQVPDDDEMLVRYREATPQDRTANRYGEEVLREPAYAAAVAGLLDSGGSTTFDSGEFGEVWVTVVPVRARSGAADARGALIVINFLDDEHDELNSTLRTYAVVAILSLVLISLLAALQSGRLLAPLRTLRRTAEEVSTTDLSQRIPERGNDDITALTRTINGMLDRLETGFADQRRFLDDAGHELRTPLTVLRGHLELVDLTDPEEVAETKDLLLEEVDRMSRLVGDLIVLAKSNRPDFVRPQPVDVAAVTAAVQSKARVLAEREWTDDGAAQVVAVLDEQRITQALLQLADNAAKHTSPGAVVAIGSAVDGNTLRMWVRDAGDGVPPQDRQRIFERFGRGEVGAGDEGFGLGLSIVQAIAEAHSGRVTVSDARPRGARFTLSIPLVRAEVPVPVEAH